MKDRYYAEPGTAVAAAFGPNSETRRIEWPSSGYVEAETEEDAAFLDTFAESAAHQVTTQPPDQARGARKKGTPE